MQIKAKIHGCQKKKEGKKDSQVKMLDIQDLLEFRGKVWVEI